MATKMTGQRQSGVWTRAAWRISTTLSRLGERWHVDSLTYNPWQMWAYHQLAIRDAPAVASGLISVFPSARRYADVGAGSGAFAAALKDAGREAVAAEQSRVGRLLGRAQGVATARLDLTASHPLRLSGPVDLAYSFEVAEHLPHDLGDRLVECLATLAPTVVFTAAPPGQGGLGHVNEQPATYWEARFARFGLLPSPAQEDLRRAFRRNRVEAPWFASVMVFRRRQEA